MTLIIEDVHYCGCTVVKEGQEAWLARCEKHGGNIIRIKGTGGGVSIG